MAGISDLYRYCTDFINFSLLQIFLAMLMQASIFGVLNNRILLLGWKAPERCLLVLF